MVFNVYYLSNTGKIYTVIADRKKRCCREKEESKLSLLFVYFNLAWCVKLEP